MDSLNQLIYYAQAFTYAAREAWQAIRAPLGLPVGGQAIVYGLAGYGAMSILWWAARHVVQVGLAALAVLVLIMLWQRG